MLQDRLVFSHANGFPAPVYGYLLEMLSERFQVSSVRRFGHDPEYPVAKGWDGLTRQLTGHVQAAGGGGRLWLVGHSLGGYLSVLAAARLGPRVAGVILLDSPLITGFSAHAIRVGRRTGLDRHLMPLEQTRQRRVLWPDVDAAYAHFAAKPAFATWHPRVLRDYAQAGTEAAEAGGRRLLFDREVEHRIYRTLPTRSVARVAEALRVPVGFVAGSRSREVRMIGLRGTRRVVGERLEWLDGSHLFPMERPEETAQAIIAMARQLQAATAPAAARHAA